MARSRMVKPEFWSDEKLAKVSRDARLTYIGLWSCSDDYGVTKGNAAWLKSQIFPYDDIGACSFTQWLKELEGEKRIVSFNHHGENYYYLPTFRLHQRVDRPSRQRNPEPPEDLLAGGSRDCREGSRGCGEGSRQCSDETETETEAETEAETETETRTDTRTDTRHDAKRHLRYVFITDNEREKLIDRMGEPAALEYIERLDGYIGQIGEQKAKARYKSHYDTMLNWYRKDLSKGVAGGGDKGAESVVERLDRLARKSKESHHAGEA